MVLGSLSVSVLTHASEGVFTVPSTVVQEQPHFKLRYNLLSSRQQTDQGDAIGDVEDGNISTPLTWLSLYHDNNRKLSIDDESLLTNTTVELGGLVLTDADLPAYRYPAYSVTSIDISDNAFSSIDFFSASTGVAGDIVATNVGASDLSPLFRMGIGGDLNISGNPQVNDIALLGFANMNTGRQILLDPASQYARLMDASSPVCQAIVSGDITVTGSNGDSGTDYCEMQNQWVLWHQSRGYHMDLTQDAELFGKDLTLDDTIDIATLPASAYPVPVIGNFYINSNTVISDTSRFSTIMFVDNLTVSNGAQMGNTKGLRGIRTANSISVNQSTMDNLDDLSNLEEINGIIRLQSPSPLTPETHRLRDLTGIENARMQGASFNVYSASYYDAFPSGDAIFCQTLEQNSVSIYGWGSQITPSQVCESGSVWQEYMEDIGTSRSIDTAGGIESSGLTLRYLNIMPITDENIPTTNVEVINLPSITLNNTQLTHVDFLSDVETTERITLLKNGQLSNLNGLRGMTTEMLDVRENGPFTGQDLSPLEDVTVTGEIIFAANTPSAEPLDLTFLDRMPLTYSAIDPPSVGPNDILPKGEGAFCRAVGKREIAISNATPTLICDVHPFVEASNNRQIRPYGNSYNVSLSFFEGKNVRVDGRYLNDSQLYTDEVTPFSVASFSTYDSRVITNLNFVRGMTITDGDANIGFNTRSLTDLSGLEGVTFSESASAKIILNFSGSGAALSGISNLDDSVKRLVISSGMSFTDKMTAEGETCTRIRDGALVLESTSGSPLPYDDYCETL